jgi:hypothetical protein
VVATFSAAGARDVHAMVAGEAGSQDTAWAWHQAWKSARLEPYGRTVSASLLVPGVLQGWS